MFEPDEYVKDHFVVNRWILRCAGLWRPDTQSNFIQIPYKIYATFVFLFVNLWFTTTEFVSLFYTYRNLNDFIKNINFFLTHLMGAIKCIFWFFKGHVLLRLMKTLESSEFRYESCAKYDYYPGKISKKYKKIGIKYTLSFLMLAHMTLSSSYVPPLINSISAFKNGTEEYGNRLPYYSWMPFPYNTPGTYLLALGYQAGPMFSYAYSIVGMDSLFMNIMNCIAANLTILQGAFMTVQTRVLLNADNNNREELLDKEMKKNCQHLQTIFSVCKDLENVHKYLTLTQATATLFILCTCLYLVSTEKTSPGKKVPFWLLVLGQNLLKNKHISHWMSTPGLRHSRMFTGGPSSERAKELIQLGKNQLSWTVGLFTGHCSLMKHLTTIKTPANSKQFYAEIVYMIAMGFQLYLYCWFGNEVTLKANELPDYIWESDWIPCHTTFKRSIIMTMTRMKKPIYMTVGNFAPLTLQTFMSIIKTSYSAFAVIKNTSD